MFVKEIAGDNTWIFAAAMEVKRFADVSLKNHKQLIKIMTRTIGPDRSLSVKAISLKGSLVVSEDDGVRGSWLLPLEGRVRMKKKTSRQ